MSSKPTHLLAVTLVLAISLTGAGLSSASASPVEEEVTANRAVLNDALERYEAARADANEVDAQAQQLSAELDALVAEEQTHQQQLQTRVTAMYRSGEENTLALLLGASSIQDLVMRLEFLARLAESDAQTLDALQAAKAEVRASAENLLAVQANQAQSLETLAAEVAAARAELAESESALKEYEAKVAAAEQAAAAQDEATQDLTGTGEWKTAVASHYSMTFTGRGASGEPITPYSMMVAHKTLPFGTLIEFEYNGKRAVASVEDRGPYVDGREFDLGPGVVRVLGFNGVHEVRYRIIG